MLSEFEADGPQLDEELDYPLRIVLVTDDPKSKESEMEEILLDRITSFRMMNVFLMHSMTQWQYRMKGISNTKWVVMG